VKNKTKDYHKEIIESLKELKQGYPTTPLGNHLSTALDGYGDIWGLPDKEFAFALTKYKAKLSMDVPREPSENEINKIIEDAKNLYLTNEEEY